MTPYLSSDYYGRELEKHVGQKDNTSWLQLDA